MKKINELISISEKIRKCYLELIDYEVKGNNQKLDFVKKTISYLIQKENLILDDIFKSKADIQNLNQFLVENPSYNESFYDKIFNNIVDSKIHPLIIERLTIKYSAKLANIQEEFLTELEDSKQLEELGIESNNKNLKYINTITWNLSYLLKAVTTKLEFSILTEQLNENHYSDRVRNKLNEYKTLFVFSSPNLERNFIFGEELSFHIPTCLYTNNSSNQYYQQIHHNLVYLPVMDEIKEQIKNLLNSIYYISPYEDSVTVMYTLYLSAFTSLLFLLDEDTYLSLKQNIFEQLDNLTSTVRYQQIIKLKMQFEYAFAKREKQTKSLIKKVTNHSY